MRNKRKVFEKIGHRWSKCSQLESSFGILLISIIIERLIYHASMQHASMQQANIMQASMVSVTAPALRGSGGPTRANRRRRLSLTTAASACWPASPASLSRGGSLIAACSSARGPPRPSAPTRF
ncbi:hypothetical protein SFRURICE_004337 [Spodoptera frugiperda]|nr:hypothetical protein SFRURICE_004337 [Spodoptera frugiperda]